MEQKSNPGRDARPPVSLRICDASNPERLSTAADHWLYHHRLADPRPWEQLETFEDSWLFKRLGQKYRLSTGLPPDIVIAQYTNCLREEILRFRGHFGFRPLVGFHCMESWVVEGLDGLDFSISLHPATDNNFYLPVFGIGHLDEYEQWRSGEFTGKIAQNRAAPKNKFCLFLYQNMSAREAYIRNDFCKKLARYKSVDCPGFSLNNMRIPGYGPHEREKLSVEPWDLRSQYKFAIVFENESLDYYLTQKIRVALMAGSIPIYRGAPQVAEYINPECFINCHDYPDLDAVIERVKAVDQDPELYERYRRAPVLLPDSKLHDSSPEKFLVFMEGVMERALERRRHPLKRELAYRANHCRFFLFTYLRKKARSLLSHLPKSWQTPLKNRLKSLLPFSK